jgi:HlyD family secretion protein
VIHGPVRIVAIAVAIVLVAALLWLAWRPNPAEQPTLTGYVEGEPLYLAAPVAGALSEVSVVRGQRVVAGMPLFAVDPRPLTAQQQQAAGQVAQASGQVGVAGASHAQLVANADAARANAAEATREAQRAAKVYRENAGAISQQDVDKASASAAAAQAQALAAGEQARAAAAQVDAAEGQRAQAQGALAEATARLSQLRPLAPGPARVEDVYFQTGEWASANQPIVSLLPDSRVRVRFFVGEAQIARYRPGLSVHFACDACRGPLTAVIDYVSPRPEYTPPEIFSREDSQKLVFLVEAEPARPDLLTPGQPVQVTPLAAEADPAR